MEIYFRNNGGNRVGFISGTDIKDNGGNRLGYINGNEIRDSTGNRIGVLNAAEFKDSYGNRVGSINGGEIRNNYGERVGYIEDGNASNIEMCAAGFLLFGLKAAQSQQAQAYERPPRKEPEGFLGWALVILSWILLPFYENIKYFKYTADRKEWWGTLGRMFLIMMLFTFVGIGQVGGNAVAIVMVILSIPIILVSIRRMRDIGRRGWWILVPIAGFIMCGFFGSAGNANQ